MQPSSEAATVAEPVADAPATIDGAHPITGRELTARLFQADCRDVLRSMADNSIDSVVTDPPYALVSIVKRFGKPGSAPAVGNDAYQRASAGFMGKQWDTGETAFSDEFWAEVLRVLKPGGHVVAFSGTRTYHRMAVAIEDAGFEIRDQLGWLYGSGFPKSHDVSKGIDRAAGVDSGTAYVAHGNNAVFGNGKGKARGVDRTPGARLSGSPATPDAIKWQGWGTALKPAWEPICLARKPLSESTVAANVLRWGTGALNIDGCRVGSEAITIRGGGGGAGTGWGEVASSPLGRWPANIAHDGSDEVLAGFPADGDESAARFFYCAKASRADRDEGLGGFAEVETAAMQGNMTTGQRLAGNGTPISTPKRANTHPTVKPTALMQWLCRMVTPPGGTVLDPFMGSGSTGKAALREGFDFVGCEREDEYMPIAKARVASGLRLAPVSAPKPANDNRTPDLFSEAA